MSWTKIAKYLLDNYVSEGGRCLLCEAKVFNLEDRSGFKILGRVYLHFRLAHPDKIHEARLVLGLT